MAGGSGTMKTTTAPTIVTGRTTPEILRPSAGDFDSLIWGGIHSS